MFESFEESRPPPIIELLQSQFSSILESTPYITTGDEVKFTEGILRGHGIVFGNRSAKSVDAVASEDDILEVEEGAVADKETFLKVSVNGFVRQVNRLLYIEPLHSKYIAEPGDVIVGRIIEVSAGRWLLEVGSAQAAVLQLASIALPSGEQRRKTDAEAIDMRRFFVEDDLLSTEVQKVNQDGSILLHTRSGRYGKLSNGCCVCVPPTLVSRLSQHMVTLPCGVHVILGKNGFFWIGTPPVSSATATLNFAETLDEPFEKVTFALRERIVRVRNCIVWLARHFMKIYPQIIQRLFTISLVHCPAISDILKPDSDLAILRSLLKAEERS